MNIYDQLQADGFMLKKVSLTNGGEFSSSCPVCGGNDRFRIWPNQGDNGRYWCRQCDIKGDLIQYLIDYKGMRFPEACEYSGNQHRLSDNFKETYKNRPEKNNDCNSWCPKESCYPPEKWQDKALKLVQWAEEQLWTTEKGRTQISWLKTERLLSEETIKQNHLGLLPKDFYRDRLEWDIPEAINDRTGKLKKLWLPGGLVIPNIIDDTVIRLRIRRINPGEFLKYFIVPKSDMRPYYNIEPKSSTVLIVESELDAILLSQELGEQATVVAMGSVTNRPDRELFNMLSCNAKFILLALDTDAAGAKESHCWWKRNFPKSSRCIIPPKYGKDPTEALNNGLDLQQWFQAGIEIAKNQNCIMVG